MYNDSSKDSNYLIKNKVLPKFFISLLVLFMGMMGGYLFIPPKIAIFMPFLAIFMLIIAFVVKSRAKKRKLQDDAPSRLRVSMTFVYVVALILGVGMYPAIAYYLMDMGTQMVMMGVGVTVLIFGSLTTYAYFSKRDFSSLGAFLFIALLALILVSIIGMFFIEAEIFYLALSFVGILIFSGYILYDISRMKQSDFTEEDVPMAVLDLLLDFINILLDVLRIMSILKD